MLCYAENEKLSLYHFEQTCLAHRESIEWLTHRVKAEEIYNVEKEQHKKYMLSFLTCKCLEPEHHNFAYCMRWHSESQIRKAPLYLHNGILTDPHHIISIRLELLSHSM